jgi:hypothetical protein
MVTNLAVDGPDNFNGMPAQLAGCAVDDQYRKRPRGEPQRCGHRLGRSEQSNGLGATLHRIELTGDATPTTGIILRSGVRHVLSPLAPVPPPALHENPCPAGQGTHALSSASRNLILYAHYTSLQLYIERRLNQTASF